MQARTVFLMLTLTITIEETEQFRRTFTRFTEQLEDLRQVWPGVIPELRQAVRDQFAGQGVGPAGKWPPLAPAYSRSKARHYPGRQPLVRTGRLYASLVSNTRDSVVEAQKDALTFGTRAPGAAFHQSARPRKRLPRRPVIDLNEAQKIRIMKAVHARLLSAVRGAGVTLK